MRARKLMQLVQMRMQRTHLYMRKIEINLQMDVGQAFLKLDKGFLAITTKFLLNTYRQNLLCTAINYL